MAKIKVTVVVCVYNTKEYLTKCFNSIVNQTLKDIEIIIVNDGSTDGGIDIIRQFEGKDSRIVVFDVENKGVSKARNMGLENARGECVIFIDSDDYLEINMLEDMYQKIKRTQSDMAVCNFRRVFDNFIEEKFLNMPAKDVIFTLDDNKDFIANVLGEKVFIGGCVWNKLYNTAFIRKTNLIFEERERIYAEDAFFHFKSLKHMKKVCIIDKALYNYYQRGTSVSYTYKENLAQRCINFISELETYYDNINFKRAFAARSYTFLVEILYNEICYAKGYKAFSRVVKNSFFRNKTKGINLCVLSKNHKLIYFLYRLKAYYFVYALLKISGREGTKQ